MVSDRAWTERAACRGMDPEVFFPERGDSRSIARAKEVCADCPVQVECLEANAMERSGIYGGTTALERRVAASERYHKRGHALRRGP